MGRVASSVDNALIESFWSTMQRELLDRTVWDSRAQLASAMFEWIEGFYNPRRRHTSLGNISPADYEATSHRRRNRGMINTQEPSGKPGPAPVPRGLFRIVARPRISSLLGCGVRRDAIRGARHEPPSSVGSNSHDSSRSERSGSPPLNPC
ncbi:integrase core domain-containing protein [Microbacterium sp. bgisy207]|uniref:integrase core domain-containing protein n=1 Tax=Microbacterium sp. bgisy207 TaxID=3413800 RepID=UPI003EBEA7B2